MGDERCPLRIEIGRANLKNNVATVVRRDTGSKETAPLNDIEIEIKKRFEMVHDSLYEKAVKSWKSFDRLRLTR